MHIKGSAKKGFKALTSRTTTWLDVTTTVGVTDVVTEDVKTRLLKAFFPCVQVQFEFTLRKSDVQECALVYVEHEQRKGFLIELEMHNDDQN